MSDLSAYEQLGVTEDASFDEIQEARNRLIAEFSHDRKQAELIEAAYDAVLMDRLRLRQEGKIKVPDVIRFPEKNAAPAPKATATAAKPMPAWLERLADDPERPDIIYPAVINLGLSALLILFPSPDGAAVQVSLAIAVGACLYFLNRKEHKFGRALLLTLVGLIVGLSLGAIVSSSLAGMLSSVGMPLLSATAVVTLFVLWFVSSFLR